MRTRQTGIALALALLIGSAHAAAPRPNHDAFWSAAAAAPRITAAGVQALPSREGYGSIVDRRLGTPTFLWERADAAAPALTPYRADRRSEQLARDHLRNRAGVLGLSRVAIDAARVREVHDTGRGPLIVRFVQVHQGRDVVGRELSVMLDRGGRVVATSGYFAPAPRGADARLQPQFTTSPEAAIARAFADLGVGISAHAFSADVSAAGARPATHGWTAYRVTGAADAGRLAPSGAPRAREVWFATADNRLVPAYQVVAYASGAGADLAATWVVGAADGAVLLHKNLIDEAEFSYRVFADDTGLKAPFDGPFGNAAFPVRGPGLPRPDGVPTQLVTLESAPVGPGDPWLAEGITETAGNNADAYADLAAEDGFTPDSADLRARITAPGVFDHDVAADSRPSTARARSAAVTNLFYVNNWLHDFWYGNGFDEAAGNAQLDNFGRGGFGGDSLHVEAQDYSGRNNANMRTPPDGADHPRMQMYVFDGFINTFMNVTAGGATRRLHTGTAVFGAQDFIVTAPVVLVDDGVAPGSDACQPPLVNAAAIAGNIALIDRGTCSFAPKALAAQQAGAVGVIIANNQATGAFGMGQSVPPTPGITVPTMSLSQEDGNALKADLLAGPVTAKLNRDLGNGYDGTLDNAIVAHEWAHYLSNRLVADALGLVNQQGRSMGEGWGDFSALMLLVREEDAAVRGNARYGRSYGGISSYAEEDLFFGIRRGPYTTNRDLNPLSFRHIEDGVALPAPIVAVGPNSEVHNSGEIWCLALWELYTRLLNDPRYTFRQAQERMKDYVVAGLKMTPAAPTFTEARDGILAAALATDAGDFRHAAAAFASRGLGVGAVAPDRISETHDGVVESFVAQGAGIEVDDVRLLLPAAQRCDGDDVLDANESGNLRLTLRATGTRALRGATVQVTTDGDTTLGGGGAAIVPRLRPGESANVSVPVTLHSGSTAQALTFTIAFPDDGARNVEPAAVEHTVYVAYDLRRHTSAVDGIDVPPVSEADWSHSQSGGGGGWSTPFVPFFGTGNMWYAPDNPVESELILRTPVVTAGAAPLTVAFDHYFQTEFAGFFGDGTPVAFDGGVIEARVDGGPWVDVFDLATLTEGDGYNVFVLQLGRFGFGDINASQDIEHLVLDFGTALNGSTLQLRFRLASDNGVGDFGWVVDNVAFTGAGRPFSTPGDEDDVCRRGG